MKKILLIFAIITIVMPIKTNLYAIPVPQENPSSTIWRDIAQGKTLTAKDKIDRFVQDANNLIGENQKIPQKNNMTLRIATYDVHSWSDSYQKPNLDAILQTIKAVNADILVLQEVNWGKTQLMQFDANRLLSALRELGYSSDTFCEASMLYGAPFGNMILAKLQPDIIKKEQYLSKSNEKRCFIKIRFVLPGGKIIISVYGVHLDALDSSEKTRLAQINELFSEIRKDPSPNILIAGNLNSVRKKDYNYALPVRKSGTQVISKPMWDLLVEENTKLGVPTPLLVDNALKNNGFIEAFSSFGTPAPKFTAWTGTVVDYIVLHPKWSLPIIGNYVFYSTASNHLALIVDIKIK